jgi:hypothetical protein
MKTDQIVHESASENSAEVHPPNEIVSGHKVLQDNNYEYHQVVLRHREFHKMGVAQVQTCLYISA